VSRAAEEVGLDVVRLPAGGEATLAAPRLLVVVGAALVPPKEDDGELLTLPPAQRRRAARAWKRLDRLRVSILVDGGLVLDAAPARGVVAMPSAPGIFRGANLEPVIVTPREGGVSVESYFTTGAGRRARPKTSWEVWLYVA
jgi:hypothetical protein